MKASYGMFAAAVSTLGLALLAVPNCAAQCAAVGGLHKLHTGWQLQSGQARFLPAAFPYGGDGDQSNGRDPIVGMWHVKLVVPTPGTSETTTIDAGYAQWHSDGTEVTNSGSRPPSTGNICFGVWEKVGERHYKLNHYGISWGGDPATLMGPGHITEDVTLDPDGNKFTGTFTVVQYDENLNIQNQAAGTITGTRITIDTPPSSIF